MFKREHALRNAKITILIVVIITVVNIGLLLNGILFGLPYALYSPQVFAFLASYSFNSGDVLGGLFNFLLFFLITGTFIYTYTTMNLKPKIVVLAFVVFLIDTIYCLWMMYRPGIYDPLVIITVVFGLVSIAILNKYPKNLILLIALSVLNFTLWMISIADINRTVVLFDLIFKLWILVSLALGVQLAYDKEKLS
ncbi:MAG: hypothetical protein HGB31_07665 [Erysipelotrichaceae bacterium]|nr:hypothetical protein [Erysipelotrichaceae bacterium]